MHLPSIRFILLLALIVRVALLAAAWDNPDAVITPDSGGYIRLASNLALNNSFADPAPGAHRPETRPNQPEIFRTPGYPLFLLLGAPAGEQGWRVVLAAQVLLDVALVYLLYLLGALLCSQRVSLLAALLQAVSAAAVASSLRLLSDGLFTFLLTLAVLLLVFFWRTRRLWSVAACAAALVAATYVRPVGQVYIVLVGAFLLVMTAVALWSSRRRAGSETGQAAVLAKALALLLAIAIAGLAPWVARNAVLADYRGFSSFADDSVYFFAVPEIIARRQQIPPAQARQRVAELDRQDEARHGPRTPGQAVAFRQGFSREMIETNAPLYIRLHLRGSIGYFMPADNEVLEIAGLSTGQRGTSDVLRHEGVWAAVRHYFGGNWRAMALAIPMVMLLGLQYAGALVWLLRTAIARRFWRRDSSAPAASCAASPAGPSTRSLILFLVLVVFLSSLLSGPFGLPRYRVPMMPLINLAAAAGMVQLLEWWRRRRDEDHAAAEGLSAN